MKFSVLISLMCIALSAGQDEQDTAEQDSAELELAELELAEPCDVEACQLPSCRCSGTDIPGGLEARDTPQFVILTFDDGVNINNIETYKDTVYNRFNSNGCKAGATFYVNHEYTNYQLINELYNEGYQISLHSISHQTPQSYWAQASYEDMKLEFGDQKAQMSHFANIPESEIKGIRIPFLQMTGNASFQVILDYGLEYDCTWGTQSFTNPGLWPYTLDYESVQDCQIPPCPDASLPSAWVLPMVAWTDLDGSYCVMVDSCYSVPDLTDEDAWFNFIVSNFERHYLGNRAPFGFYIHEWYISSYEGVRNGLIRFMDMIHRMEDVYMVNSAEVIEWVRDPVPLDEYRERPCKEVTQTTCEANTCGPLSSEHNEWSDYWMTICGECPENYPWLGNPLGL